MSHLDDLRRNQKEEPPAVRVSSIVAFTVIIATVRNEGFMRGLKHWHWSSILEPENWGPAEGSAPSMTVGHPATTTGS